MKYIILIIALVFIICFSGCEQVVEDPNLPFVEQVVINAPLTAGRVVDNIIITKTLPPLEDYDMQKALVPDADVKIICEGKVYTLQYTGQGLFGNDSLIPEIGRTYELQVRWNGKYAHAITTIPQPVTIDSAFYQIGNSNGPIMKIFGVIKPKEDRCYRTAVKYNYDSTQGVVEPDEKGFIYVNSDKNVDGNINIFLDTYRVFSNNITDVIKSFNYSLTGYGVAVMDNAYYDYIKSRHRGGQSDDIFGTSGENIKWNIQGDGIGLFYGRTITIRKIKL